MTTAADTRVLAARQRCVEARQRLIARVEETKRRMSPEVLANDAVEGLRAKAGEIAHDSLDAVKQRPWTVAAAAGLIGLFLARRPIAGWIGERLGADDATADEAAS